MGHWKFIFLLTAFLWCLINTSALEVLAQEERLLLTSDELFYDTESETLTAVGNVELIYGEQKLLSRELVYERATGMVTAIGDVVLVNQDGESLIADRMELSDGFAEGVAENLVLLLGDGSRIEAVKATRENESITKIDKAVYSPCKLCPDGTTPPLWQIRATRAVHDRDNKVVAYRNAVLEIFGLPIFYTPFFFHPDPTVERQSGFLAPTIGTSNELGFTLQTPFHIVLDTNRDLTIKPLLTTNGDVKVGVDYRHRIRNGLTLVEMSGAYTDEFQSEPAPDSDMELRGHVFAAGSYTVSDTETAGFNIRLSSDNSYLQRFGISDASVLENRLFFQDIKDYELFTIDNFAFQGLRPTDDQGLIPVVAPLVNWEASRQLPFQGIQLETNANVLNLIRSEGLDSQRASVGFSLRKPWVTLNGVLLDLEGGLRTDAYLIEGDASEFDQQSGRDVSVRAIPFAEFNTSWPLVSTTGSWLHTIEPIGQVAYTLNNVNLRDIPNEDSAVFEFDETNLFERDRFNGFDRVESGLKFTAGIKTSSVSPTGFQVSSLIGQSYRTGSDRLFRQGSGLEDPLSDYVGRLDLIPNEYFDLSYRFRLAKDFSSLRRSDLRVVFGSPEARAGLQYLQVSEDLPDTDIDEREELVASLRLQLSDHWAVSTRTRRDLTNNRQIKNQFGVMYRDECITILAGAERNFTTRGELEDETAFLVRISLTNLGNLESESDLFN